MQKQSFLDVWRNFEYACVQIASGNVLCHHSKHLMGYFEFLNGSRMIFLPFEYFRKTRLIMCLRKEKQRLFLFIFFNTIECPRTTLNNDIYHSNKQKSPPFFHLGTNSWHFFIRIPILFCWQNPCSGCNSGTDLVIALEYIPSAAEQRFLLISI